MDSKAAAGHNHRPPDETQLKVILFREQVKQIVSNHPDMKPSEILDSAQMLLQGSPASLGLKNESIMRYIQRIKSKNRQQLLKEQQQLEKAKEEEEQQLEEKVRRGGQIFFCSFL